MKNLAGDKQADLSVMYELIAAGLSPIQDTNIRGEVPTTLMGRVGDWTFYRAWYYWVAKSPTGVELETAKRIHEMAGQEVRVDGHCGCPAPDEWWGSQSRLCNLYHVDTQQGLKVLVDAIILEMSSTASKRAKAAELEDRLRNDEIVK